MVFHQLWPNTQKALGPTTSGGFIEVNNCLIWCSTAHKPFGSTFVPPSLVNWSVVHCFVSNRLNSKAKQMRNVLECILGVNFYIQNLSSSLHQACADLVDANHPIFLLKIRLMFRHMSRYQSYVRGRFDSCHDKSHVTNHMFEES